MIDWISTTYDRISLLFYNIKNITLGLTISIVKDDFGDPSRVYGLTTVRVTPVTKILFCITHTSRPKTLRPSSSGTVGTRTRRNARSYCFSSNANAADCNKRACLSVSDVKRIVRSGLEKKSSLPPHSIIIVFKRNETPTAVVVVLLKRCARRVL